VHVSTSLPAEGARASPVPPLRSTANKMGRRHRRQRTPRYHCLSALGHEETFTRLLPARFGRTQRLTAINLLRGSGFLSSYCFPEFANASSVVDLGSSLTMKARTVTISSGHAVLFQADKRTETQQRTRGFFLEVFDRHRGRQSRNESQENYMTTIARCAYDSNTIYEHTTTSDAAPCSSDSRG
jgi:hypothetical protein